MVWFYCWDVVEHDFGEILLFGALFSPDNTYSKCCITTTAERIVWFVPHPKELDTNGDILNTSSILDEIREYLNLRLILEFEILVVRKKNPFFGENQPLTCNTYVQVKYSAKYRVLDHMRGLSTNRTFTDILGRQMHTRETFLLDRKIKGPCWMDVQNADNVADNDKLTRSPIELHCAHPSDLIVLDIEPELLPPPATLTALAMQLRCLPGKEEVSIVSLGVCRNYFVGQQLNNPIFEETVCFICPLEGLPFPDNLYAQAETYKFAKLASEKALLSAFARVISNIDPDIIVGHDLINFQMNTIFRRACKLAVRNLILCTRFQKLNLKNVSYRNLFEGRLICDTKSLAKEILDSTTPSYDLDGLCRELFEIEPEEFPITDNNANFVYSSVTNLVQLIIKNGEDVEKVFRIMHKLNVLPLTVELAHLTGCTMSRCLVSGQSEKVENLLLNAFYEANCIVPDWTFRFRFEGHDQRNAAGGGLVLNAKCGLYEKNVILFDFISLYPSIIREHNICFTSFSDNDVSSSSSEIRILPKIVADLVETRRQIKQQLNGLVNGEQQMKIRLNSKQKALKMIANSIYGNLGFRSSRFYARPLARLIANIGRDILNETKDIAERMHFEIIYGDTDSIMINTNTTNRQQICDIITKLKTAINQKYRFIKLDVDKIFKYILITNKKNYAAVIDDLNTEYCAISTTKKSTIYKGLEIMRRNHCLYTRIAGQEILSLLFNDRPLNERFEQIYNYATVLNIELRNGNVPLSLLVKQNEMGKNLSDYKVLQPYAKVAQRYLKLYNIEYQRGDTIPYVICLDDTYRSHTDRAYHIQEVKAQLTNTNLTADHEYYLSQELTPILSRMCAPINSGFDKERFKANLVANKPHTPTTYNKVLPFQFTCPSCNKQNTVYEAYTQNGDFTLKTCSECSIALHQFKEHMAKQIKIQLSRYEISVFGTEYSSITCPNKDCKRTTSNFLFKNTEEACPLMKNCPLIERQIKLHRFIINISRLRNVFDINKLPYKNNIVLPDFYNFLFEQVQDEMNKWSDIYLNTSNEMHNLLNQYPNIPLSTFQETPISETSAAPKKSPNQVSSASENEESTTSENEELTTSENEESPISENEPSSENQEPATSEQAAPQQVPDELPQPPFPIRWLYFLKYSKSL